MITDTITCFHSEIGWDDDALVKLWHSIWHEHGWNARVVGEFTAVCDPRYQRMMAKIATLPCVNPPLFQTACLLRWLVFARYDGAMADYDVFPVAEFPPRDFGGFICGDATCQPGFVVGAAADFSAFADEIIAYEPPPNCSHTSDQEIMRANPGRFSAILDLVRGYLMPGWEKGPLVHFSNDAIGHCPFPGTKAEKIKAVLETL